MEKKDMPVLEGLQLILQRLKPSAIYEPIGKSHAWFSQRYHECRNRDWDYAFTENDIYHINESLPIIAETIASFHVTSDCTRMECVNNIRTIGKVVKLAHIRDNVLQCKEAYWKNRTQPKDLPETCYRFTESELQAINAELQDIAKMLQSIHLA